VHGSADAVDVTGAGDTVIAACTVASRREATRSRCAFANVAGRAQGAEAGTVPVSAAEIEAELARAEVAQPTLAVQPRAASRGRR